jgi:hypothetical protein
VTGPAAGNTGTGVIGVGNVLDPSAWPGGGFTVRFVAADAWRSEVWRELPSHREDLRQRSRDPLTLQYAGPLDELRTALAAKGWESATMLDWSNLIKLLSPSLPLQDLPILPQVHDGHHESLTLVKPQGMDHRRVLRLWETPYRIGDDQTPLWIGNLTGQTKKPILDLIAVPTTQAGGLPSAAYEDFSVLQPLRPAGETPLLLGTATRAR